MRIPKRPPKPRHKLKDYYIDRILADPRFDPMPILKSMLWMWVNHHMGNKAGIEMLKQFPAIADQIIRLAPATRRTNNTGAR
jgi:hypothetical protein